jgi:D-alanine--D-alanine ligase
VENALSYPVFVKPSNAGSSCGVSKAKDRASLIKAIEKALLVDRRVLVEESIVGRELECAVFSGKEAVVETSSVGEILAAAEFYDYDAKYNNPDSKTELHPDISKDVEDKIKRAAEAVFLAVDGFSLSRVDFFLSGEEVIFNEINTMPGFTSISMYPMLFKEKGYSIEELVERLLESAFHRP